jgi:hypothetical protein
MIIKVIRRNRPDCVKVTNNNVTITDLSDLLSDIEDALKYWEEFDRNAVRLDLESLNGKK